MSSNFEEQVVDRLDRIADSLESICSLMIIRLQTDGVKVTGEGEVQMVEEEKNQPPELHPKYAQRIFKNNG